MSKKGIVSTYKQPTATLPSGVYAPSAAYEMREVFSDLARVMDGAASITMYVTLEGDKPEWSEQPVKYTRKEVLDNLARMAEVVASARGRTDLRLTRGAFDAADAAVPSGSSDYALMAALLRSTYECKAWTDPKSGDTRAAETRPAFGHLLMTVPKAIRDAAKAAVRAADMADALAVGEAWYCSGITDKDGNLIAFLSEDAARKRWARETIGSDWHASLPSGKGSGRAALKRELLAPAPVYKGSEALPVPTVVSEYGDIDSMHPSKVRSLAREAGASDDIVMGAGATERCRVFLKGNAQEKAQALKAKTLAPRASAAPADVVVPATPPVAAADPAVIAAIVAGMAGQAPEAIAAAVAAYMGASE